MNRTVTTDIPVTCHQPEPALFKTIDTNNTAVRSTRSIINCSDREVTIILRSGLRYILPPRNDYINGTGRNAARRIEVVFSDTLSYYVKTDVPETSIGYCTQAKQLQDMIHRPANNVPSANYYYTITFDEITECGGVIYDHTLDMVISIHPLDKSVTHPHAVEDVVNHYHEHVERTKEDTHFRFFYVDRWDRYGKLYSVLGSEPFEIPRLVDPNLEDGVHLITNGWSQKGSGLRRMPNIIPHLYYSFEDLAANKCPIRVYTSYALAKDRGNPEAVFEQTKLEIKRDTVNRELILDEIQAERKIMEHKAQTVQAGGKVAETAMKVVIAALSLASVIITFKTKIGGGKSG